MVRRIASPPGTSPTPTLPALSVTIATVRVKNGPWAPLRLSSMLSCPATGTTSTRATVGVVCSRCYLTLSTSAVRSAWSAGVRSVSGGRTRPPSRPTAVRPALMMETA